MLKMWGLGDGVTFTHRDRLLALALEYYEHSISEEHGMSTYLTTHDDYDGHFTMQQFPTDLASYKLAEWQKKRGDKELPPGQRWGVVFTGTVHEGQILSPSQIKAVTDG